jgi:hypothetical protein
MMTPVSQEVGSPVNPARFKGPLTAKFAAMRVRVADGLPQRDRTPLPGEEVWLIGERRTNG